MVLTVPPVVPAAYLVPVEGPAPDARQTLVAALTAEDVERPGVAAAEWLLSEGRLHAVEVDVASVIPSRHVLAAMGAADEQLRALERARRGILLTVRGRVTPGPRHEMAARVAAERVAVGAGADVVVDLWSPEVVEVPRLTDGPEATGPPALARLVTVPMSPGESGYWMTTKGLGRYGLPELQVLDVPESLTPAWGAVLLGLGLGLRRCFTAAIESALAADGEMPAFVEVGDVIVVTPELIALAQGAEPAADGADGPDTGVPIRLRHDPSSDLDQLPYLTVCPPEDLDPRALQT